MKLSEAIRLGAMLKEQAFNDDDMGTFVSCALRAAADAVGLSGDLGDDYGRIVEAFELPPIRLQCPVSPVNFLCEAKRELVAVIWHLNDHHHWTREQIADWVETIEQQQDSPKPEVIEQPIEA